MTIGYTPYQLVYGLDLVMPIEYVLPTISEDHMNAKSTNFLTTIITNLEKL